MNTHDVVSIFAVIIGFSAFTAICFYELRNKDPVFKIDASKVEYDGRSVKRIVHDPNAFMKELEEMQAQAFAAMGISPDKDGRT